MTEAVPTEERRTAPVGLVVKAIAGLRQSVAGIAALVFVMRDQGSILWIAIGVVLLVAIVNVAVAWLQWHRLTFHVGTEDIRVESGIPKSAETKATAAGPAHCLADAALLSLDDLSHARDAVRHSVVTHLDTKPPPAHLVGDCGSGP